MLYLHLQSLEATGLVSGRLELSGDGKAMKFYELTEFNIPLSPETIAKLIPTLSVKAAQKMMMNRRAINGSKPNELISKTQIRTRIGKIEMMLSEVE